MIYNFRIKHSSTRRPYLAGKTKKRAEARFKYGQQMQPWSLPVL